MSTTKLIKDLAQIDILKEGKVEDNFIGRPFYLDYDKSFILINDHWKNKVNGIPQGSFLLAFYDSEESVNEAILLRALKPAKLPTDNDVISSMVEYYKDNLKTSGKGNQLDQFTKYEFSFSGLECRVLGTFYKLNGKMEFGADLENFYSANNYRVFKASDQVLMQIVNQRDRDIIAGNENEFEIGYVRYSSSRRFNQENGENVKAFINPKDFLGKRTALFGMTRTGKSNTVKKIIEATVEISKKAIEKLPKEPIDIKSAAKNLDPFLEEGGPKHSVGQIIFDINGEYANPNMQDEGTAIFELFRKDVTRYSVLAKPDFKVMKVNFFKEIGNGFELIKSYFDANRVTGDYVNNFAAVDLTEPEDKDPFGSEMTRYDRIKSAYLCCLYKAGFELPKKLSIKFKGNKEINDGIDPSSGINIQQATTWFEKVWKTYYDNEFFKKYEKDKGHEWADDDLKSLMIFLSGFKQPGERNSVSGYKKIRVKELHDLHTNVVDKSFEEEIPQLLRDGKIIIIDLSQGSPIVQGLFSERICKAVFNDSMSRFIQNIPNNFIQFYFEEAHNLFPKKDDNDLSQIYNRIAKEGAKLNLGLIYATQEVSSISSNILKNTQNWFIAHLNNEDEIKELRKYYDFSDFADSLIRFSAQNDKGFVRMKTYSNPFVVPVQINRFLAKKES